MISKVKSKIKYLRLLINRYNLKKMIEVEYQCLEDEVKVKIKYLRLLISRYGLKKVLLWSTPVVGTTMLLSELEDMRYRHINLSRYTFNYVSSKIWELEKKIKELEEDNTRIYE